MFPYKLIAIYFLLMKDFIGMLAFQRAGEACVSFCSACA